ncbi:unnamed protein product [Cutaneotrichosporon oleaginosum]
MGASGAEVASQAGNRWPQRARGLLCWDDEGIAGKLAQCLCADPYSLPLHRGPEGHIFITPMLICLLTSMGGGGLGGMGVEGSCPIPPAPGNRARSPGGPSAIPGPPAPSAPISDCRWLHKNEAERSLRWVVELGSRAHVPAPQCGTTVLINAQSFINTPEIPSPTTRSDLMDTSFETPVLRFSGSRLDSSSSRLSHVQ